jgi:ABC-type multidrug transport system fused ATPase/permease subunit
MIEENYETKFSDKIALDNISLSIKSGTTVALVGHSGSGKSTIFKLLQRFYDISSGKITIDNKNIQDITLKSLRNNISVVSQDVAIFSASVRENVSYCVPDSTDDDIKKACELANATEFIIDLPSGLDTALGPNGILLSGGQKQRISIARALLKNSPILLLDEATSALDPISEKLIQRALHTLMANRTTIIIAHRLSTVQNCDNIFVLRHGKIIETGNHETLMKQEGHYAELYLKQFEKATNE